MPGTILFDLFHTLLDGADAQRDRVVARMGEIVGVDPSALVRAYHDSWPERLVRWSAEETVRVLAGRLGVAPSAKQVARAAALRLELASWLLNSAPSSTLVALDGLRAAGWRLGLVSNATAEVAEAWPGSGLSRRFDAAVFSCEAGVAKPEPGIYRAAAAALGVAPSGCVFVGDGADGELAGAAAVGAAVVRTAEFVDRSRVWAGPVVGSLAELSQLLGEVPAGRGVLQPGASTA
ncbi:HAD family hydrolase [Catellatospora vulcania]|uniref:HAD family hydrolase n=1 Tax=Catellatospora vulcania TaxID=1460450 RepID=UPI0012D42D13|nr:HAD-IA family hydrolase [Catellatospora vulcania]